MNESQPTAAVGQPTGNRRARTAAGVIAQYIQDLSSRSPAVRGRRHLARAAEPGQAPRVLPARVVPAACY
ncbi:MAG TPA: hypothetical protein VGL51_08695 [Solirubrobacteraceae bacterium]|jgi:hypothetical protein